MRTVNECIDMIYEWCKKLCYTDRYSVYTFDTHELDDGSVRIDFSILYRQKLGAQVIPSIQEGTVYISNRGNMYYYNYLGKKKALPLGRLNPLNSVLDVAKDIDLDD